MNTPEQFGKDAMHTVYASFSPVVAPSTTLLGQILDEKRIANGSRVSASSDSNGPQLTPLDAFVSATDDATRLLLWFGEEGLRKR